jgi:predicted AlkP superfamily phosphohydrolase/phosphomutase
MTDAGAIGITRDRMWSFFAAALALLILVLACPVPAHAYVGPGAGFAVLSSFLTLFLAFLYSLVAFVTWPVRQIFRLVRRRHAYQKARVKRAVIIGFDGMDPKLATRFMEQGKMPNLAKLREQGTFLPLATTVPPISPVAWSSFLTGVNPGKHNIYDFLAPDRKHYLPYLSSAQIEGPRRSVQIGKYNVPLGRPQIKQLRKAKPFWHFLADAGVFCSVIRVPITFPPEKFSGVLLSGMCVPDVKGSQGTFSFHTTRDLSAKENTQGVWVPIEKDGALFRSYIPGPENTLLRKEKKELRAPFTVRLDASGEGAEIKIGKQHIRLRKGEYSEWAEIRFKAGLGIRVRGISRFYLKETRPDLEIYCTPVNIDPAKPALPISHPLIYSVYLAKLQGLYATLGLAEDTWALNDGFISDAAFLEQCYLIHEERERMFFDALEKTSQGVCVCVFDITDRVQHMFWRYLERDHPAARATGVTAESAGIIEELYRRMDALVGRAIEAAGKDSLMLVLSDHGFQSFQRGVSVNNWLHQNGYLALKDGQKGGDWFANVDWERTRAYALGLNGIFLNQKGRERSGIVNEGKEARDLRRELCEKLHGLEDAQSGRVAITQVHDRSVAYSGPYVENAPDVIVGFGEGYRVSWDSAQGRVTEKIFEDNTKAWSGDHCVDADLVPGVLFSNWKIAAENPAIVDVAPTILDVFGMPTPPHMDGKRWKIHPTN